MKSIKLSLLLPLCLLGVVAIAQVTQPGREAAVVVSRHGDGPGEIRLVLQITVDGLRADLLARYRKSFGDGGFRRLLDEGASFGNAHYRHANTETIVGHTTLATGATPAVHGMIGNAWLDRESGELGYNLEDPDHPALPTRKGQRGAAQVDPAQKAARSDGRSPRAILAPTFSDSLAAYTAGKSKIFAVSGKDRGAIPMAGHAGKAFWFSTDTTDFTTSTYYYDAYPDWAADWNAERKAQSRAGRSWELGSEPESYLLIDQDDRPYEADLRGYGRTFPHPFGKLGDPYFATRLLVSPVADELVADFAKSLILGEGVGSDDVPDYLALSFSSVDAVNHFFGPSSLENEEAVRALDRTLADLFAFIDEQIGLDGVLVVLSADHGMADMPEYMSSLGYEVGRIDPDEVVAAANGVGKEFGIEEVVELFYRPYVYLDRKKIAAAGKDPLEIEREVAAAIARIDGIAVAAPTHDLGGVAQDPSIPLIRNNQHGARSGDIYVAQRPYWFLFEKGPIACMHGSPWQYDTHVPIIFWGGGIEPGRSMRRVHPSDVAPSLAAILGITPPASASGSVLVELGGD